MSQFGTAKAPLVWRDMDQKALDDAYDQDVYAPNRPLIVTRRIAAAERARAVLGAPERVA
jgi:arylformamidase